MKKTILILFGIFIFLIASNNKTNYYQKGISQNDEINVKSSADWKLLSPVLIDSDWSVIESEEWCNGSGTLNDPYIISNLTIDLNFSEANCLRIKNSNKYFIITDCKFLHAGYEEDSESFMGFGIYMLNVDHGIIKNCEFLEQRSFGVAMDDVNNILVSNNTFIDCPTGIYIHDSAYCNITGNVFTNITECIDEKNNTEVLFEDNICNVEDNLNGNEVIYGYKISMFISLLFMISTIVAYNLKKRIRQK